ncbi:phage tail spike protein [Fructilactobacillus frigidiflavus]|uniref:phage tail spike protein n=1 Tax=Fructilactobacillus frigidiflavus TaxID=3242688 RepID=UPI003757D726
MNLFLIDKNENVIGVVPDNKIIDLSQSLEINQADVLNGTITLDKSLNLDDVRYFAVPDRDNKHNLWMYRKTVVKVNNDDITIQGVNAFYDDLKAYGYIKDKRPNNINAEQAVHLILGNTRWNVDFVDTALNSSTAEVHDTNFYYLTYLDAIKKIEDEWTVEIQPFINIEGNKITRKYVNLYWQMGGNNGQRFVYGKSALEIVKESNDTDVYTALIGRGSGIAEQDDEGNDTGGYSRKITFADVEWSKAKGDPMDKPLGQEWIEWPQATKEFGYSDGTPRFGIVEFENEEDPANLLKETWESLKKSAIPSVQFSATVGDVGFLNLGETVAIVRYDLDIKYQTRVVAIDWNRKNEKASKITLGDKLVQSAADRYRSVQSAAYKARDVADQASNQANFAIDNSGTTIQWGSNEPAHPKEGDIWYDKQPDGTVVMKKYENGQWIILIDDTTGEQIKNKVEQAEEDVKQLRTDTDNAQATINSRLNANDVNIANFNDKLIENDKKISNLNSDVDTANKNAVNLQNQVNEVDSKANNIKNTADSAITIANDAKNGLLTKVDSSYFHSSIQQVDNAIQTKVSSTDFNTRVTQLDNAIQTKVNSDTFYSEITQLSNGISSTVSKIDNLQVGGTNLLPHSKTWEGWNSIADAYVDWGVMYKDFPSAHVYNDWARLELTNPSLELQWNCQYTASVWVRGLSEGDINIGYYDPYNGGFAIVSTHVYTYWTQIHLTFTAKKPEYPNGNRRDWEAFGNWGNVSGSVYFAAPKLEAGNVVTDWSPSPNDLATQSQITQLSDSIQTKVSNAEYESKITQLANGIQSNVNQINSLSVGGTNLLKNTKTFANTIVNSSFSGAGIETNSNNQFKDFTTTWALGLYSSLQFPVDEKLLEAGKTYTVSAWLRGSGEADCDIRFYSPRSWAMITNHLTTEWKRYHVTFVAGDNINPNGLRCDIEQAIDSSIALYVAGIKLEEGNMATDWSPAPEDLATSSQITQLNDSINTKVGNSEYESKITQLANGIQSNVNNINGLRDNTNSQITQLNNSINTKVSSADFYSRTNQLADGISSTVAKVDGLQVGGTNFLPHSRDWQGWNSVGNAYVDWDIMYENFPSAHVYAEDWSRFELSNPAGLQWYCPYTASVWVRGLSEGDINIGYYDPYNGGLSVVATHVYAYWTKIKITFNAQPPTYPHGNRRDWEAWGNFNNVTGSVYFAAPKLEAGTFATAWSPAPEDMATQSQITQLSDNINMRVQKNDIINQINISNEGVLIDGRRTHITGQTVIDNAAIKDANIDNLSASKLTAGVIDCRQIDVMNIAGYQIMSNQITADKMAANSIMVGLNNSLTGMHIYPNGLTISENGKNVLQFNKTGIRVSDPDNNEEVGWIHANSMVNANWFNGLQFDLDPLGDYMGWGVYNDNTKLYDLKIAYYKNAFATHEADSFVSSANVNVFNSVRTGKLETLGKGILNFQNAKVNGGEDAIALRAAWGSGCGFYIAGDHVYVKTAVGTYDLDAVIHSIGRNQTWN